jgi:hypothetical protein
VKNQGVRERECKSAKFKAKKERESTSAKSFAEERESASAKTKKSACPALLRLQWATARYFYSLNTYSAILLQKLNFSEAFLNFFASGSKISMII